jgi:hypothetical protein
VQAGAACLRRAPAALPAPSGPRRAAHRRLRALHVLAAMNTALVFIKPHAVNDKVVALAKDFLGAAGCAVVGEGVLTAEAIGAKGIIDDHYAALAANAVKLKPSELLVGDKNKAAFKEAFGADWRGGGRRHRPEPGRLPRQVPCDVRARD